MNQPVLSIDVSKSNSYAAAFISYGQPFKEPIKFNHTIKGITPILALLKNLENKTSQKPQVVLEATGNFSKPLKSFFMESGYQVIELNPIQTHKQKKRGVRKVKTDPIDANRIAQVYYLNDFRVQSPLPQYVDELRTLSRQYEKITQLYRETQLKFRSIVDLIFPQFDTIFTNLCCKTSLKVISAFPTPEAMLNADKNKLKSILKVNTHSEKWIDNCCQGKPVL